MIAAVIALAVACGVLAAGLVAALVMTRTATAAAKASFDAEVKAGRQQLDAEGQRDRFKADAMRVAAENVLLRQQLEAAQAAAIKARQETVHEIKKRLAGAGPNVGAVLDDILSSFVPRSERPGTALVDPFADG